MGLFGKKKAGDPSPDPDLPFLSVEGAEHFRELAGRTLRAEGLSITVHGDHAIDSDGRSFGFRNIAAQCAQLPRRQWPTAVREHLCKVIASMDAPAPFDALPPENLEIQTYARLIDAGQMQNPENFPHREFAPGILEVLALDLPETVSIFNRENAQRHGGWEQLRRIGMANLAAMEPEEVVQVPGKEGASVHVLMGQNVFTGSLALRMPEVATRFTGEKPVEGLGWLLAVPSRQHLVFHMIRDHTVLGAMNLLVMLALRAYSESPGPVSPHVYWWNGMEYLQLTTIRDDGTVEVHVDERLAAVLEQVAGDSRPQQNED